MRSPRVRSIKSVQTTSDWVGAIESSIHMIHWVFHSENILEGKRIHKSIRVIPLSPKESLPPCLSMWTSATQLKSPAIIVWTLQNTRRQRLLKNVLCLEWLFGAHTLRIWKDWLLCFSFADLTRLSVSILWPVTSITLPGWRSKPTPADWLVPRDQSVPPPHCFSQSLPCVTSGKCVSWMR